MADPGAHAGVRIGVDLGGTKIEGLVLDPLGKELARKRVPTPKNDYPGTVNAVAALVGELEREIGVRATIGIGTPGVISPATGLMKNANSTWLNRNPLDRDLASVLGREVRLANDANCFALSEATDGAGKGAPVVFGVIVGTGTGGGIVVEGKVLTGPHGVAGEWGHNPLPWPRPEELPGPSCYCGKDGCIETFLSGPGLERDYEKDTGTPRSSRQVAELAEQGDGKAAASVERYVDRMARSLATVINVLDPDVIVLGGGMSNLDRLYRGVPERWGRYVFSDRVETPLRKAVHGDSSGVRGAAWLW